MRERFAFDVGDDLLARAAWSRVAEPRDQAAGTLVAHLGAGPALEWAARAAAAWVRPPHAVTAGDPARVTAATTTGALPAGDLGAEASWRRAVARWAPRLTGLDPRRELDVIGRRGGRVLVPGRPGWPDALDALGVEAPFCLWVLGPASVVDLTACSVAIVGSRASTRYGEHVAADLAAGVGQRGMTVVSGGAFGIDAAAHRAALAVDAPALAVMAGGLDRFYPAAHTSMILTIAERGAVVAEAPPGTSPMRQRFLSRNRLIAALSKGTVVVEATWRSGALNTASHAHDLLRPVGAVPGPVTSASSAGCHKLLREKRAECVTDAAEVLELVGPLGSVAAVEPEVAPGLLDDLEPLQARVLDALPARSAAAVEALTRSSGLSEGEVRGALGFLELGGHVRRDGSMWRRDTTRGR